MLTCDYYAGMVTQNGVTLPGRHMPIIDQATFDRVQTNLASHRASGSRGRKHQHYLSGQLTCGRCHRHFGYGRHRGKAGDHYEYYSCLSRVTPTGPCGIRYLRLQEIEGELESIHARPWLTPVEHGLIREALHSSVQAKTQVARDEADRHARRLRDLERQQEKMLQLYYRDGISIEVMQQEQIRIKRERAEVERWQQIAVGQVEDIMEALNIALLLIDRERLIYDELVAIERRLLNLQLFDDFLIEEDARGCASSLSARKPTSSCANSPTRSSAARTRPRTAPMVGPGRLRWPWGLLTRTPARFSAGRGSHKEQMAEREGFEPSDEVSPVTRFPVAPVQPLRHLSRLFSASRLREPIT